MKWSTAAFLISILGSLLAATQPMKDFKSKDGFTLQLPEDWIEVPYSEIERWADQIAKEAPGLKKVVPDYAYQPSDQGLFSYPFVIVKVARTGRVPESDLRNYKSMRDGFKRGVEKQPNLGLLSNFRQGDTRYDEYHQIIWMYNSMDVRGVGTIETVTAFKLTQYGGVLMQGFSLKSKSPTFLSIFEEMAKNIKIDPILQYREEVEMQTRPVQNTQSADKQNNKGFMVWFFELLGSSAFVLCISRLLGISLFRRINQPTKTIISNISPLIIVLVIGTWDYITAFILYGIPVILLILFDLIRWKHKQQQKIFQSPEKLDNFQNPNSSNSPS